MLANTKEISKDSLLNEVASKLPQGYRFVTITCVDLGDKLDLIYHFDKDYELSNLRLTLQKGQSLPSITSVYFAAVIVENEIKDLFGLDVTGMAIDYEGRLLLSEGCGPAPQAKSPTPAVGIQTVSKAPESK